MKRKFEVVFQEDSSSSGSRVDLLSLKEQLAEALGDSGPKYWELMSNFLIGKISMCEFENLIRNTFPKKEALIHNQLILGILKNAKMNDRPPPDQSNLGFGTNSGLYKKTKIENYGYELLQINEKGQKILAKIREESSDGKESESWKEFKQLVKSLSKADKRAIKSLAKKKFEDNSIDQAIKIFERIVLPIPSNKLPPTYALDLARGITSPLCYDTKSTPDKKSLQSRMVASALQHGLIGGVTDESVELLLYGLDVFSLILLYKQKCHLKNIASNMIYKIRSNRALGIPVKNAYYNNTNAYQTQPSSIKNNIGVSPAPRNGSLVNGTTPIYAKSPFLPSSFSTTPNPSNSTNIQRASTRICDLIYNSKQSLGLGDMLFSLNLNPFVTVENPYCLERGIVLASNQLVADSFEQHQIDLENKKSKRDNIESINKTNTRIKTQYERRYGPIIDVNISANSNNQSQ
ncbi:Transcriptional coactivator hfi1 [Smittium mucronatum]|uniref:Transcriptional coactivator hfi1 n=1 Tax=Smittium mucronatum TaxID=133383 RepID=A0A1R0H019_9FUNG|nr:Transcriptional coactivator hfi1 [Smittium mucronatum]